MDTVRHSLVVGGSGMLAGLVMALAEAPGTVSVIARDASRLNAIKDKATGNGRVDCLPVNYADDGQLASTVDRSVRDVGPILTTFAWIHHSVAPRAAAIIAERVSGTFFHVLGSAFGDPAKPEKLGAWRQTIVSVNPYLDYRQIVLGFVEENGGSRWLTNREISLGCLSALQSTDSLIVVGTISPWRKRPGF